jgi:RNA polymerase sigma-70 factor (ECF subfamily)
MLRRLGRHAEAAAAYRDAAALARTAPERAFLTRRQRQSGRSGVSDARHSH